MNNNELVPYEDIYSEIRDLAKAFLYGHYSSYRLHPAGFRPGHHVSRDIFNAHLSAYTLSK